MAMSFQEPEGSLLIGTLIRLKLTYSQWWLLHPRQRTDRAENIIALSIMASLPT